MGPTLRNSSEGNKRSQMVTLVLALPPPSVLELNLRLGSRTLNYALSSAVFIPEIT